MNQLLGKGEGGGQSLVPLSDQIVEKGNCHLSERATYNLPQLLCAQTQEFGDFFF